MKKNFTFALALVAGIVMVSCHSSESAYKKAYEKAQSAQTREQTYPQQTTTQQQTPVQVTTVTPVQQNTQPVENYSNVGVRTESVSLVEGAGLRDFSVVVGSFGLLSNAQNLKAVLANKGYSSQIAEANVNGKPFYRVIASTHNTKEEAAQSRARLTAEYPDAWLLYKK